MHIPEALFQADDRLAAGREAEMARFDDAGVHGPDWDLVQIGAFSGEKLVAAVAF